MLRQLGITLVGLLLILSGIKQTFAGGDIKNVEIENAWKDEKGRLIVEFIPKLELFDGDKLNPDFFFVSHLFYGDEVSLYQLNQTNYGGSELHHFLRFADPRVEDGEAVFLAGVEGEKHPYKNTDKYELVCGQERVSFIRLTETEKAELQTNVREGKIPVFSLPESERIPRFIFKEKNSEQYFYVDQSKYGYGRYRLWVGPLQNMVKRKIADYVMHRDGGTTYILTEEGDVLFSPTPFKTESIPTWNKNSQLEKLDQEKFDLKLLGIPGVPSIPMKLHTPCDCFFPL